VIKGERIVANSWGEGWADEGKTYVLYRCLMSRCSFWDRGPFMGYAVPNTRQPRATIRFKGVHNKRDSIQLELSIIDRQSKRYAMNTHGMFQYSGSVPLGGPGEENKDFEWGFDLTRLAEQSGDNFEQILKDLQLGEAKLGINYSERQSKAKTRKKNRQKSKQTVPIKGKLKEVELIFWNRSGTKISSKMLLSKEKTLTEPLTINYPQ